MAKYSIDFHFKEQGWGNVELDADDADQAEFEGINYVHDTYPDCIDVEITGVKEI